MNDPDVLSLPDSRLSIHGGVLVKKASKGNETIARHPLSEIRRLELRRGVNPFGVFLFLLGAGLAAGARMGIESPSWSWTGVIGSSVLALIGLAALRRCMLWIQTPDGEVRYELTDEAGDCEGFVLTLKRLLRSPPAQG